MLVGRRFEFPVERAILHTVLHRLFAPGSDRAAKKWKDDYAIEGVAGLDLHHLYRAMAWLGEVLPQDRQDGATPFTPRTNEDLIEEELFARRRDLFSDLDILSLFHHLDLLRGRRRRDHRPAWTLDRSSSRSEADGR